MAVVRFMADDVMAMRDGAVVEQAGVDQSLYRLLEERTKRLPGAIPRAYCAAARPLPGGLSYRAPGE